jgi:DNA-binding Xre family transcriptional regulator
MMPSRRKPTVVEYVDDYGDLRKIHRVNGGHLRVARLDKTPVVAMSAAVGRLIGQRVRAARLKRGFTLKQLAERAGMAPPTKHRMYEVENAMNSGLRFGTVYALAIALNIPVTDLLPSEDEVLEEAGVGLAHQERLAVSS